MIRIVPLFLLSTLLITSRAGYSLPQECQVRVLVAVTDDLGRVWKVGSVVPVDIERDDSNGGTYCAHGGSCLPRMAAAQPALMLLNCKVGPAIGDGDFRLVPDARLVGPASAAKLQMFQDTTSKLQILGVSNASSSRLANAFTNHPRSSVGRLVAKALGGSQSALATLKHNNP